MEGVTVSVSAFVCLIVAMKPKNPYFASRPGVEVKPLDIHSGRVATTEGPTKGTPPPGDILRANWGEHFTSNRLTNPISRKTISMWIHESESMFLECFHGLFSKQKPLKSFSCDQIGELSFAKVSSAEQNFPDEIGQIRNGVKSGDKSVRKWDWWIVLRESGPKIDLATGVTPQGGGVRAIEFKILFYTHVFSYTSEVFGSMISGSVFGDLNLRRIWARKPMPVIPCEVLRRFMVEK